MPAHDQGTPQEDRPSRPRHPGAGKRRGRHRPKGRGVEPAALEEVRQLLGSRSRTADLLIEHLHVLQDHYGHLSARHLAALAEDMRLPMAHVYEVATFYAHFDVVAEGDSAPAPVTIRVCDSLTCEMFGAAQLQAGLDAALEPAAVRVVRAPCMGRCDCAPVAEVGHRHVDCATVENVRAVVESGDLHAQVPAYETLADYRAAGGYSVLGDCLAGRRSFEDVVSEIEASGLRGLGGAGFPSGRKWRLVRGNAGPRLLAVNGDEGEPGTFKDRHYLETQPHRFLEGMLIAAWAVEAEAVYLYMRDEYPAVLEILRDEIAALEHAGLSAHTKVHLRRGAGAYICGEESAMIESIEGKRGLPRHRPPYVAEVGVFGQPTLVHNIETLYWMPEILQRGAQWFAGHGRNGGKGLRSYSVSGRVADPGVKLAPAGVSVRELIDEYCGGMAPGHVFKGYLPGGASGGILPASLDGEPLEFGALDKHGCFVGSHAVVVLSDADNMGDAALNLMRFFEDESCGQCTPCRVGTEKAVMLMSADSWDEPLLNELCTAMSDASICGLGQAAGNPLRSVLVHFRDDLNFGKQA